MKLLFLGVSAALTMGNKTYCSNMLLESNLGKKLLIDCGSDIKHSLFDSHYSHTDIDGVYISHLHADHTGGLEWLAFSKYFIDKTKPELYISEDQRERLWKNVLSGGLSSLEEFEASLSTYFEVKPIQQGSFFWENHHFKLIKTMHISSNKALLPSYGLFITGDSKKVFITTDTRFIPDQLLMVYNEADLIFHDCETTRILSGAHANYSQLKTLSSTIKNKIWLYDYNTGKLPNAEKDGFLGFVQRGQQFIF